MPLGRVWIDEYTFSAGSLSSGGTLAQSFHLPYDTGDQVAVSCDNSNVCTRGTLNGLYSAAGSFNTLTGRTQFLDMDTAVVNMNAKILTLPWEKTHNWGQLTLSQDKCAVTIAGLDTGIRGKTGSLSSLISPGFDVSVARIGGKGWKNFNAAVPTASAYDHWLPTGSAIVISDLMSVNYYFQVATTLAATSVAKIPTSAALSGYLTPSKNYFSRVYVSTSETGSSGTCTSSSCTFSSGATSSLYGRCWYPFTTTYTAPTHTPIVQGAAGWDCGGHVSFEAVDPFNTGGTGGQCFLSTSDSASTSGRLLQVRKAASNAIFSWPSGSSTASNLYYNPSARISDYGNNYAPATISVGTASTAGNLANCAGALGTTSLAFAAASYVFWAETGASGGAAVLRSEYTTGFVGGVSLWAGSAAVSSFLAGTSVVAPSNDVVGVAYNPATVILFAATYGELYATSTPLASSGIVWYRLASASALTDTLGAARANNFRGVSLSPKNCAASSPQLPFRQLLEGRNSTAAVAAVGDEAPLIL